MDFVRSWRPLTLPHWHHSSEARIPNLQRPGTQSYLRRTYLLRMHILEYSLWLPVAEPLDHNRGMVERGNRLRHVVEWQRYWITLGRHLVSWSEYWISRVVYKFHRKLCGLFGFIQGLPKKVLGGSSRDRREYSGLGVLDVEGRECRWMELPEGSRRWLDTTRSHEPTISGTMLLNKIEICVVGCFDINARTRANTYIRILTYWPSWDPIFCI